MSVLFITEARFYAETVPTAFEGIDGIDVRGATADEAIACMRGSVNDPCIALIDLPPSLGTGIARSLVWLNPQMKRIALLSDDRDATILAWIGAGVRSCLGKDVPAMEVAQYLREVLEHDAPYSPRVGSALSRHFIDVTPAQVAMMEQRRLTLTARELQVCELVADGRSNKEIAAALDIRLPTVKNHMRKVLTKLGLHGRREAAAWITLLDGEFQQDAAVSRP